MSLSIAAIRIAASASSMRSTARIARPRLLPPPLSLSAVGNASWSGALAAAAAASAPAGRIALSHRSSSSSFHSAASLKRIRNVSGGIIGETDGRSQQQQQQQQPNRQQEESNREQRVNFERFMREQQEREQHREQEQSQQQQQEHQQQQQQQQQRSAGPAKKQPRWRRALRFACWTYLFTQWLWFPLTYSNLKELQRLSLQERRELRARHWSAFDERIDQLISSAFFIVFNHRRAIEFRLLPDDVLTDELAEQMRQKQPEAFTLLCHDAATFVLLTRFIHTMVELKGCSPFNARPPV